MLELVWARPTAEFNGIIGGYTGKGFKTVIAAEASAKISFRLVHKQNPDKIREAFRAFVRERLPADCSVEFEPHGGSPAIQLSYESPFLNKAKDALSDEWPKQAVMLAGGGSIPVVGDFQKLLGMESLLVGFGLSDDRIHSPNEKYDLVLLPQGPAVLGAHPRPHRGTLTETRDDDPLPQKRSARPRPLRCRGGRDRHRDAGARTRTATGCAWCRYRRATAPPT